LAASKLSVFWFGFLGCLATVLGGMVTLPWNGPPAVEQLQGLTFWTRKQAVARELQEQFAGTGGGSDAERQKLLN